MIDLQRIGLIDLLILGVVVAVVIGALRSGHGVLGTLGSGLGALALAWVVTVALGLWAPPGVSRAVEGSAFAHAFPAPTRAIADLQDHPSDDPERP